MSHVSTTASAIEQNLGGPLDPASLAVFRIMLGVLLTVAPLGIIASGGIASLYDPAFPPFPYPHLDALRPLSLAAMVLVHLGLSALGIAIVLGLGARVALGLTAGVLAWLLLLDQAAYLNHDVLLVMLCVELALSPCDHVLSLDRRWRSPPPPARAHGLWMLRISIVLVYVFAGLAKLNPDWLSGQPLGMWLDARQDWPGVGPWLAWAPTAMAMSAAGLVLDLLVAPALLSKRLRMGAILALSAFHVVNGVLFRIGIFPLVMLAAHLLFLDPGWPRRVLRWAPHAPVRGAAPSRAIVAGTALWIGVQVVVPLRHLAYPGRPSWTEEGHRFAWRMMLRTKRGTLGFRAVDLTSGDSTEVDVRAMLSDRQRLTIIGQPDMIWLLAQRLRTDAEAEGHTIAVYVDHRVSLNGRPPAPLIDPTVDLSRQPRHAWTHAPWILPLPD